jgi:hypothetical protein
MADLSKEVVSMDLVAERIESTNRSLEKAIGCSIPRPLPSNFFKKREFSDPCLGSNGYELPGLEWVSSLYSQKNHPFLEEQVNLAVSVEQVKVARLVQN